MKIYIHTHCTHECIHTYVHWYTYTKAHMQGRRSVCREQGERHGVTQEEQNKTTNIHKTYTQNHMLADCRWEGKKSSE